MQGANDPTDQLPLAPVPFHILVALAEGERHGYAIMRDTERLSGGVVKLGPGTLYGAIKRLLEAGLIEESESRPDPELDDQRRRYYRISAPGERVLDAELERLEQLLKRSRRARPARPAVGEA